MNTSTKPPVVILCGGLGSRLRSLISDRPKCLAPVGDRPFLEFLLTGLESQGFERIILYLSYGAEQVLEFIQHRRQGVATISHVIEKSALIGNGLFGFTSSGYFLDIGVPADYERAQIELPERFM